MALRWLSLRELARGAVAARLTTRGFPPDIVETVVARLVESRFIDDNRAIRACARNLVQLKRRGPQRVQRELARMGFAPDLVRRVLKELLGDGDELALAKQVVAAKLRTQTRIPDIAAYRRLFGSLMRRGFSSQVVRDALKPHWNRGAVEDNDDSTDD
jgi:regulatory protein